MINRAKPGQQKEMMSAHTPACNMVFSYKNEIAFMYMQHTPRPPAKTTEQVADRHTEILIAGIQPFCVQGIPVEQRWLQRSISQLENISIDQSRKEDISDQFNQPY